MKSIRYTPIGVIHTPFTEPTGAPIQPRRGQGVKGTVDILPQFAGGLTDLDGFSHVYLIYHLHRSEGYTLKVIPFLDTVERGLFATRAPRRPNPIGLSVARLKRVEGARLFIEDVDILDDTPLLDLKPYVREFDDPPAYRIGWLENKVDRADGTDADNRFAP